jgi:hypothetical protein
LILTSRQIEEALRIHDRYSAVFIGHNIGTSILSEYEKKTLKSAGIEIAAGSSHVSTAYRFGMLSAAIGDNASKVMTYPQLKTYLKEGRMIPLNEYEKQAIESLKRQTYNDVTKQFNKIKGQVSEKLVHADKRTNTVLHNRKVTDIAKEAVERRKGVQWVTSELGTLTKQWDTDIRRIADYVLHTAFDEGRAAQFQREAGSRVLVYKHPYPQACQHCVRLYLTAGQGSQPIVFNLDTIQANGTNIGKKVAEWQAVVAAVHPNCYDKETDVLTKDGWKNWRDIIGDEEFLSVDPINGKSEWVRAVAMVKYHYRGVMNHYKGHAFDLMTTPKHSHFINSRQSNNYFGRLVEGVNLSNSTEFINIVPNSWEGLSPKTKKIGHIEIPFKTYCKFMGWYLSEGSSFKKKGKNSWIVDICQHKEQNIDEIRGMFIEIFGKHNNCSEGHIGTYTTKDIAEFFMQFGHSHEKYVPLDIKNAKREDIEIFLESFRKGDGNISINKSSKIGNSKPIIMYSTSSPKLGSDVGELIIKIDRRPSYFYQKPKPIKHKNGVYTAKRDQINIYQNRSKTSLKNKMTVKDVEYDDYVYDVELEKYHTLYVRRGGKVTISGNCRCTLLKAPRLMTMVDLRSGKWEWNGSIFVKNRDKWKKSKRTKVNVTIDGVTKKV